MKNKKNFASSNLTAGQLNAMVKNIMREIKVHDPSEAMRLLNSGGLQISIKEPCFRQEKNGVTYLSLRSRGDYGLKWVFSLKEQGVIIGGKINTFLASELFKASTGNTYKLVIIPGSALSDNLRNVTGITKFAKDCGLKLANGEVACLLCELLARQEIGLNYSSDIVVMHEPIILPKHPPLTMAIAYRKTSITLGYYESIEKKKVLREDAYFVFLQADLKN